MGKAAKSSKNICSWKHDSSPNKSKIKPFDRVRFVAFIFPNREDRTRLARWVFRLSVIESSNGRLTPSFIVVQIDGMGTAWRSKAFHDVCYRNLKDAGFPERIAWMKAAKERITQMDLSRVGLYGGSAGGQNAMGALLWHGDFYKVAVADCGCHDNRIDKIWWNEQWMGVPEGDIYARNSNAENARQLQGHLMLVVGELDRSVDPATTMQVAKRLVEMEKEFDLVVVPGAGHGACETPWASRRRLKFFETHLTAVQSTDAGQHAVGVIKP